LSLSGHIMLSEALLGLLLFLLSLVNAATERVSIACGGF
jgi:hypothetical protein